MDVIRGRWKRAGTLAIVLILVGSTCGPLMGQATEPVATVTPVLEPPSTLAEEPPAPDPSPAPVAGQATGGQGVGRASLLRLFRQANPMLWPLVACSIVTLGFGLDRLIALRRSRILPREFSERFLERISNGKIDRERAIELCRANDCALARVFGRIVSQWGQPTTSLQEIADREIAGELQELKRNVRVLNATATLAPLLGLLGTVVGLIEAFDALSTPSAGIDKNEALAHGISLALMATAFGLVIAVLSVALYYFLLHRVDSVGRALELDANRLTDMVAGDSAGVPLADLRR